MADSLVEKLKSTMLGFVGRFLGTTSKTHLEQGRSGIFR
jgi:hypothetical protein